MALIKCPECGKDVSDTCEYCIHCGYRLSKPSFEKTEEAKPIDVSVKYSEVLVNRNNHIKSVAPLVWGIILAVLTVIFGFNMFFGNGITTTWVFFIMIFGIVPCLGLSTMCFILFGTNNQKTKRNNQIAEPLVRIQDDVIIAYDTLGNAYKNTKGFIRDGYKLYTNVQGEKIFLGWMSDPNEYTRIYNR